MSGKSFRHPITPRKRKVVIRKSVSTISSTPFCYNPCPGLLDSFIALEQQIFLTQQSLQQYYQADRTVAEFIAKMSARCTVPPVIFVRLVWRQEYSDTRFEITNAIQRLQIKDIYLRYGFDHTADPIFKDALGLALV